MRELTLRELSFVSGGESDEGEGGGDSDGKGLTCEISTDKVGCTGSPESFKDAYDKITNAIGKEIYELYESWYPAPKPLFPPTLIIKRGGY